MPPQTQWWLDQGGARRRVDAAGVLLGRSPRCDFVLHDPKASRSQAIVYLGGANPRLCTLGRGRTCVNSAPAARDVRLSHGDRIAVPGLELTVVATSPAAEYDAAPDSQGWVLDRPGGGLVGVSYTPFTIGGHETDNLNVAGWADHAFTLHLAQGRLVLLAQAPVEVDGVALDEGVTVALSPGSRITHAGQTLRVVAGGAFGGGSTMISGSLDASLLPERVELEFLPRGGRLRIHAARREYGVFLPGARCDLMALLLSPPGPHRPGEVLDDDVVIARIWPGQARTRVDLNTLIYRLRRDLVRAGIDATRFVVRAAGGGGTKLGVDEGVDIRVE